MPMDFQILDADYEIVDSRPVIRLFGRGGRTEKVYAALSRILSLTFTSRPQETCTL